MQSSFISSLELDGLCHYQKTEIDQGVILVEWNTTLRKSFVSNWIPWPKNAFGAIARVSACLLKGGGIALNIWYDHSLSAAFPVGKL